MSVFVEPDNINTDYKKFIDYTNLSTVTYFNQGSYGIGYKVKMNDISRSNYNVLSLRNTENTIKCGQLFVKISPIYDGNDNELYNLIKDILGIGATPSRDFVNEIRVQTEVYKKSNANLEAICPPIVYSNVVNNTEVKSRAQNLLSIMINKMPNDNHKIFLERMKRLYEGTRDLKLGIIAMSFAENYDTLSNVLNKTNNPAQQIMYKYLAVYELLRMYDLGYMHGDYHMGNILINTNYKYSNLDDIYLGRCLIIDYGMAFKNKYLKNSEVTTSLDKLHKIAEEKQPDTYQNAYSWDAYKWIVDFINSESDINSGVETLKENIDSFQRQMIEKINENYPGTLERIRDINVTFYRESVLRGGRAIIDNQPNLSTFDTHENKLMKKDPVKLQIVESDKTLSTEDFIQIFNPQNMNINEVVSKYENTLRDGIAILNTETKTGGKKTNNKSKQRKIIKKKKTRKTNNKSTKKKKTRKTNNKSTKKKKTRKTNNKFKKTHSKIQSGGTGDVKLAILLITTHGNLDNLEEPLTHNFNINIRKVNATIPGVCNFIENDELLEMGNKMTRFIALIKEQWYNDNILKPSAGIELEFKSPAVAQQHIDYLSQSLRSFIPRIDGVYKETVKATSSKRVQNDDPTFIDPNDPDPDVGKYSENIDKAYKLYKWNKGDQYLDKTYTIIPDERSDTTSNPYNNTVLFLSEPGISESNVINIPYNLRSNKMVDENKQIKLSEILKDLTDNGYTDVIIIDLSCSTGWDDIGARALMRNYKKGDFPHYGGK